jgi:hypothetical protein
MSERKIYIKAATQISIQQPLCEDWMTTPLSYDEPYVRSIDPNFRDWLNPLESRRMGKILKRAIVTAQKVMRDSGISQPDAIITGTGLGCIENTELFLDQLCREGEEMLKPTYFMQSTHNTISSLIAIQTKCHGYNITYSHKGTSFDSAFLDAYTQLRLGDIQTALVTGNDEMTPSYFRILQRTGYIGQPGEVPAGETSVAMMLTADPTDALCQVESCSVCRDSVAAPSLLVLGTNGTPQNDAFYEEYSHRYPGVRQLHYKRLFGESYTVSGLGLYAAAHLLHHGDADSALFVNHGDGGQVFLIQLKAINSK